MFHVCFAFHTYPNMKEASRNWRQKLNTRGVLLGITRDCSSHFQLQSAILQNITMSTIFSTLAHLIQLWPIKLYVVFMERKLMIIMFSFLQVSKLSSDAEMFELIYQTLIPEKKIRPTTITTSIYWEWTSCERTKEARFKTILIASRQSLNWLNDQIRIERLSKLEYKNFASASGVHSEVKHLESYLQDDLEFLWVYLGLRHF